MKVRRTIYIEQEVWEGVKESAWGRRESASAYLEKLIRSKITGGSKSELAEKVDSIKDARDDIPEDFEYKDPKPGGRVERGGRPDAEVIAEAQAKLDKIKKELKSENTDVSQVEFGGSYSKEQQLGKKGAKKC